ncbi:DUF6127 family protein [Sphingomicrobium sp. XHP0239]|uniref:DUF6127 family protein n=1 Tax=Sphingomicrobium maritimum TaxID=3133972 RepID=UPI0031CC5009
MSAKSVLAELFRQADEMGMEAVTLSALIEEASERGARRALTSLGLEDKAARRDMDDLRELLGAWRSAKKSAGAAVVSWVVKLALALLLVGLAVRVGMVPGIGR